MPRTCCQKGLLSEIGRSQGKGIGAFPASCIGSVGGGVDLFEAAVEGDKNASFGTAARRAES